jgi:hypothetical protein
MTITTATAEGIARRFAHPVFTQTHRPGTVCSKYSSATMTYFPRLRLFPSRGLALWPSGVPDAMETLVVVRDRRHPINVSQRFTGSLIPLVAPGNSSPLPITLQVSLIRPSADRANGGQLSTAVPRRCGQPSGHRLLTGKAVGHDVDRSRGIYAGSPGRSIGASDAAGRPRARRMSSTISSRWFVKSSGARWKRYCLHLLS